MRHRGHGLTLVERPRAGRARHSPSGERAGAHSGGGRDTGSRRGGAATRPARRGARAAEAGRAAPRHFAERRLGPVSKVHRTAEASVGGYGGCSSELPPGATTACRRAAPPADLCVASSLRLLFDDRLLFNSESSRARRPEAAVRRRWVRLPRLPLVPGLNLRGGLLLMPMGFANELHERPQSSAPGGPASNQPADHLARARFRPSAVGHSPTAPTW
jgi:hypothetical protein